MLKALTKRIKNSPKRWKGRLDKLRIGGNKSIDPTPTPEASKGRMVEVFTESQGSKNRRRFLKIGAALAELAGGTDYAKEAASGDPITSFAKDTSKTKPKKKPSDKPKKKSTSRNYIDN